MCAQMIKNANIFGRLGTGVGKGLAEQLPKEVERNRLATGLKDLAGKKDLTPFEQFAELSAIPGATPQMIESGSKLLRQQGIGQALMNKSSNQTTDRVNPFKNELQKNVSSGEAPSLTSRTPVEATLNPDLPKDFDQLQKRAGELYQSNPALYPDPEKAMQAAIQEDASNQNRVAALQSQRLKQQDVQNTVKADLQKQNERLLAKVPGGIYSDIEDKAINAVKSNEEGGEGLTEQEAIKKYGKELDAVSRQYQSVKDVGSTDFVFRGVDKVKQNLKAIRNDFKERNDLENLADLYNTEQQLSPSKAYYLAYPPSENKELNNTLSKIPEFKFPQNLEQTQSSYDRNNAIRSSKSADIFPEIAKAMGKEGSPLAIYEELKAKNYDADAWMDYLDKNRKKLDLGERQGRELGKPRNNIPTLNDNWLFLFSGLDKLVEQ